MASAVSCGVRTVQVAPDGIAIFDRLSLAGRMWHAPHLLDVEVMHVLRRYALLGELTTERAEEAVELLRLLPLRRHAHEPLLDRMWALRANVSAYDAAYIALAEGLRMPLVTRDRRIAHAASSQLAIELV